MTRFFFKNIFHYSRSWKLLMYFTFFLFIIQFKTSFYILYEKKRAAASADG